MIRRLVVFSALLLFSSTGMATVCLLPGATQIPANSTFALGPTVSAFVTADPNLLTTIVDAYDAWDGTDAVNRIGGWDGTTTGSDCPAGQPSQIGAFNFSATPACATNTANGIDPSALAYVDYFGTGTLSISFNLNYTWALNPGAGEYDIQGVLAHEFGHVLGFAHQQGGICSSATPSPSCATSPGRETMGPTTYQAETCMRTIESNDEDSANWLY